MKCNIPICAHLPHQTKNNNNQNRLDRWIISKLHIWICFGVMCSVKSSFRFTFKCNTLSPIQNESTSMSFQINFCDNNLECDFTRTLNQNCRFQCIFANRIIKKIIYCVRKWHPNQHEMPFLWYLITIQCFFPSLSALYQPFKTKSFIIHRWIEPYWL